MKFNSCFLECEPEAPELTTADHNYNKEVCTCSCHKNLKCNKCSVQQPEPPQPKAHKKLFARRFVKNDRATRLNTGLPNKACFDRLFCMLEQAASRLRYWQGAKRAIRSSKVKRHFSKSPRKFGPRRKLSLKSEFLLTLMKLRLGSTNEFLATTFAIMPSTCSAILHTWITFLGKFLKPLVFWPDKGIILSTMPPYLRAKYPKLRVIIDCSETPVERPHDLKLQAATWSEYKKSNTLKYLVGITPRGMISFISRAWGGRATDRYITQESGFLRLLERDDTVMADRGFPIQQDLLFVQASLVIPPPSAGLEQMCAQNVMKTKNIANARIHVERAINRLKWFNILECKLALNLLPLFDDILIICSALCNLHPPLMA